jgi:hypothetical protein
MLPSAREAVAILPSLALAWPAWTTEIVSGEGVRRTFPPLAHKFSRPIRLAIFASSSRGARTIQTHWRPMPFAMPHALERSEEYQK